MKQQAKATTIFDRILDVTAAIAASLIVGMMLLVTVEVCLRYFLNRPMVWVITIIQWSLVFMTFLGAAWLLRREGHVIMDFVLNQLSQNSRDRLNAVTSVFCAIVCLVIFWFSLRVNIDYFQVHYIYQATVELPAFILQAVVPLGSFLLFIQFLRRAYGYRLKVRMSPKPAAKVVEKT